MILRFSSLPMLLVAGCAWGAGPYFNVLDYGARNDASASSTEAFRAAIQAAKAAGGGTVYVPAGNYVTGPIELVSNLVLSIDAGATLRFPAARLPFVPGRQQGVEALTPVPLVGGRNLENVTLTGRGTLASDNAEWMRLMPRLAAGGSDPGSANGPNWERLLRLLEIETPASPEDYLKAAPELRPSFVRTMDSRNVLIEGLHFAGSPMWTIHLLYSDNVTVHGVTIETYPGVHTDGIVVDSSRNVRISDCYIDTGDDGIVIKSGKDADGMRVNRPSEDIAIDNCTVRHAHGAVTLGSETSGWIRNLTASNIACHGTNGRAHKEQPHARRRRGERALQRLGDGRRGPGNRRDQLLPDGRRGARRTSARFAADAGVPQHRHRRHEHQPRARRHRGRRLAGDAHRRAAALPYRGVGQGRHESVQYGRAVARRRAGGCR